MLPSIATLFFAAIVLAGSGLFGKEGDDSPQDEALSPRLVVEQFWRNLAAGKFDAASGQVAPAPGEYFADKSRHKQLFARPAAALKDRQIELEVVGATTLDSCAVVVVRHTDRTPPPDFTPIYLVRLGEQWMLLSGALPFSNDYRRTRAPGIDTMRAVFDELREWFERQRESKIEVLSDGKE